MIYIPLITILTKEAISEILLSGVAVNLAGSNLGNTAVNGVVSIRTTLSNNTPIILSKASYGTINTTISTAPLVDTIYTYHLNPIVNVTFIVQNDVSVLLNGALVYVNSVLMGSTNSSGQLVVGLGGNSTYVIRVHHSSTDDYDGSLVVTNTPFSTTITCSVNYFAEAPVENGNIQMRVKTTSGNEYVAFRATFNGANRNVKI